MGRKGARRRKSRRPLPKVHGKTGQLWSGESPVTYEQLERSVGRAGPRAQARYFRGHPSAAAAARVVGLVMAAVVVAAAVAVILR